MKKTTKTTEESQFQSATEAIIKEIHKNAVDHGWWGKTGRANRNFGEVVALVHGELSEALEWSRQGNPKSDHIPEFTGIEEEFADVIIRIFDYAGHAKLKLADAIIAKMKYNKTRPYKHGKKF